MSMDIIATPYEEIRRIQAVQRAASERDQQRAKNERQELRKQARIAADCITLTEEQWIAKITSLSSGREIEARARRLYASMKDEVERWEWVLIRESQ